MSTKKAIIKKPLLLVFSLALGLVTALHAAGQKQEKTTAELRFGITSEPVSLDPLSSSGTADGRSILFNVFEGLVKPDTEGSLKPAVAESWSIEENGRRYRFTIRQGIRFSDGSAVTAADAEFAINTAIKAKFAGFTDIEKLQTEGDRTLLITLNAADPEFLACLTLGIVPKDNPDREKNPVGTGPFRIESYTAQHSMVLAKNPLYWQSDLPKLDRVTVVFLAGSDALLPALRGGSIDAATVTGSVIGQLDPSRFDIVPGYSNAVQLLALNNEVKALADIRVRQAINYAVDIKTIIDTAFYGRGEASGSPLIPGLVNYYEKSLKDPYPADTQKAKRLLDEAGYGSGGRKLSLQITVPSNYGMHIDTAQVIVNQLAAVGIDARINLVDWAAWLSEVYRNRKYEATIISLDASNVSPKSFLSRYHSAGRSNFINYKNDVYDKTLDAAGIEADEKKRAELYKQCQKIISADAASVFIQDILSFRAFPKGRFGGVLNYPLYVIDFAPIYRN